MHLIQVTMTQNKNINLVPPKETLDKLDKEISEAVKKAVSKLR